MCVVIRTSYFIVLSSQYTLALCCMHYSSEILYWYAITESVIYN